MTGTYAPGDIVLCRTKLTRNPASWFGLLIRFGAFLRYGRSPYNWANHACIITSPSGDMVEALGRGVVRSHIGDYAGTEHAVVNITAGRGRYQAEDRKQMVSFAERQVGVRYGFLSILSLAGTMITGSKFVLDLDRSWICSELAASALLRADIDLDRAPARTAPADLATFFGVVRP